MATEGKRPKFAKDMPRVRYTTRGKQIVDWTDTAPVKAQIITARGPRFEVIPPSAPGANVAPDFDHLRRENAIPATPPKPNAEPRTMTVNTDDYTPEQRAKARDDYKAWKRERNIKDALTSQDPRAEKTTNASLHVVDTSGGRAKYHAERQRAALEIAKGTKGADRKFALALAKEHGAAKRAAGGGGRGQKRVPSGQTTGGQWTK